MALKILIACEESQVVTKAFRERGFEAYSCDIQDCSGGHPEWHIKSDILYHLKQVKPVYPTMKYHFRFLTQDGIEHYGDGWHFIGLHSPCTYTSLCSNRWYYNSPLRIQGAAFTKEVYELAKSVSNCVYLEQPKTIMQKFIGNRSQVIQPYQFGHMEQKETWLWLHGLPKLEETENVFLKMMQLPKRERERVFHMSPSKDRSKLRSKTYPGIAEAMAEQWGNYLINKQQVVF